MGSRQRTSTLGGALALLTAFVPVTSLAEAPWPVAVLYSSEIACPDRATVERALQGRGVDVVTSEQAALQLEIGAREGVLAVTLRDRGGQVLAERTLEAGECEAVADAIVVMVERPVHGVDWEGAVPAAPDAGAAPAVRGPAPQPSTPHPDPSPLRGEGLNLHAHAGVLLGNELEGHAARPGPAVGLRLLPPGLFDASLSFAWIEYAGLAVAELGTLDVDRFPIALGASVALRRPRWEARVGGLAEVDVLAITSNLPHATSRTRAALRVGPAVGVAVSPLSGFWIDLGASLPIKVLGYELVVIGIGTVDRQARFAFEVGASAGVRFGA